MIGTARTSEPGDMMFHCVCLPLQRVATSSPGTAMKGLKSVNAPLLSPQWKRPGSVTLGKLDMAEKACK